MRTVQNPLARTISGWPIDHSVSVAAATANMAILPLVRFARLR